MPESSTAIWGTKKIAKGKLIIGTRQHCDLLEFKPNWELRTQVSQTEKHWKSI